MADAFKYKPNWFFPTHGHGKNILNPFTVWHRWLHTTKEGFSSSSLISFGRLCQEPLWQRAFKYLAVLISFYNHRLSKCWAFFYSMKCTIQIKLPCLALPYSCKYISNVYISHKDFSQLGMTANVILYFFTELYDNKHICWKRESGQTVHKESV